MSKKAPEPLPESLAYLEPFVKVLSKLPPDKLNEDVDPSLLNSVLRERLRGLDTATAVDAVSKDSDELQRWLKSFDSQTHPAHWVWGYLSYPLMAGNAEAFVESLVKPPPPPPRRYPTVEFEPPQGWTTTPALYGEISLKEGKSLGVIKPIDERRLENQARQYERKQANLGLLGPPGSQTTFDITEVRFGTVVGNKYALVRVAPSPAKHVEYLLRVPGGFVSIRLTGAKFDESPFESKLHTLRVS
jgi:hypothetical protein